MNELSTNQKSSTPGFRSTNWKLVLGLSLLLMGGAIARPFVTNAQNQGMGMKMAEDKGQGMNQGKDQKNDMHEVSIDNFSFTPMEMTIPAGTQVTWINKDDVPHTVVSVDHQFKSKALDTDEKFSFTFSNPGTYEYFCSVHPKMTGKIVVK
jgi:plastocyanin